MAGDWIKFENCTPDKPEVWALAEQLEIDPDAVIGKLLRVWIWFDRQTENGNAPSVTKLLLDSNVCLKGFCDAMIWSGWMVEKHNRITLTNFDRHNGSTAKNRILTAKRVSVSRKKCNGNVTVQALPREEKRRTKDSSNEGDIWVDTPDFDIFWERYPRKENKKKAKIAFDGLSKTKQRDAIDGLRKDLSRNRWDDCEKKFILLPTTYINGARWEDEIKQKEPVKWT